ncbi:AAA family ATPase [Kutzneria sp. NPDC052558]|uniref:AAA family ATPase n=1 Tax=Kutzneria sp. NPDC052558 TaxID=3364121 RepID=UPI0037C6ED19
MLLGRRREQETLDGLVRDVRDGRSRVLVLRGEAGAGKTALLDYLAGTMPADRVSWAVGVESESEIAYATLQRLCAPLMGHVGRLPEPQREALLVGLGERTGTAPDALLVGLAVLGLLAEAAAERPLLCVVDDVQWLDKMSEVILTFVARRLDAESVALVFASRDEELLDGLPELRVDGLPDGDARALLDSVLPVPVDARVRDRIVAETRGNPLALLELPRGRTPAELAFGLGGRTAGPIPSRIEQGFQRRIAELPPDTRTLLLAASVEPLGDVPLLWRALSRLGVGADAAAPAESAELLELGARVRFRHPLVRSASWCSATPAEIRAVHQAFADVTDPRQEPDRRAWHRAHATLGLDDEVAAELSRSAERARSRGGHAAAAAFLERAAELSADPKNRAARALAAAQARFAAGQPAQVPELLAAAELGPLEPLQQAEVERLRAQVAFAVNRGRAAGPPLLAAACRLADLDLTAAREAYLAALGAAVHAGEDLRPAAEAARALPTAEDPAGLLLTGVVTWALDGYVPALPQLRRALTEEPRLLIAPVAMEIWDDEAWRRITGVALAKARATGTLSVLPTALTARAGALLADLRLTEAAALLDEARTLREATGLAGNPFAELMLLALQGKEKPAVELAEAVTRDAAERGEQRLTAMADHALSVLYNGLGRYAAAQAAAARVGRHLGISPWAELVEAAAHAGDAAAAAEARDRLAEHTVPAGTDWALGAQALADAIVSPTDDQFREAIDRLPLALSAARARLLYGEWLRRENRRADARDQLRPAYEAFLAAGAAGFAERAGRELAATGETVRKRGAGVAEELTPQEAQIARLALAGRTNPEIAAALFLSPRTVEWHLRKVFTKLGISSRRELATSSL